MPRQSNPLPRADGVLHLKEAPAIPGQWEAWCWLWRRLLVKTPPPTEDQAAADSAPEEPPCPDHADHQGQE